MLESPDRPHHTFEELRAKIGAHARESVDDSFCRTVYATNVFMVAVTIILLLVRH